jgi:hypothetical protein
MKKIILLIMFLVIFYTSCLFAHGVDYQIIHGGVGIELKYHDGSDFAKKGVEIFAPGEKDVFQAGVTDINGRFFFFPTVKGKWRIVANDGKGHGLTKAVEVTEDKLVLANEKQNLSLKLKALIGLPIIFWISGVWFYMRKRK